MKRVSTNGFRCRFTPWSSYSDGLEFTVSYPNRVHIAIHHTRSVNHLVSSSMLPLAWLGAAWGQLFDRLPEG